ncbi:hypothetical protein DBV05_g11918 [Lasiodiplodia theobromae]|uniref:Rhodopsin domain-containing protein n=2 Tax=Lasiodiplodia theobromae TaxID=45133 RepID=A0A5N5CVN9_9PEZI|nr:hypothetical protein DBV05_g11918 [Lasiodiplodia theobromae]
MIILMFVLLAATLAVVGARLWARCRIRRNAGLDDWLIVAAIPILLGYDACHYLGFYYYGVDRHAWEVTIAQAVNVRIVTWAIACGYMLITSLVKISILMFYRRLSEGSVTMSWIYIVRGFIVFVVLYCIIFTLMLFVDCRPLNSFWNKMNPVWAATHEHVCFNEGADFIASAVVSVVTDAAVCILPLLVVRRLRMPRKQKWALSALFGVGFFLCFCGIMRVAYMYEIYYATYDTTWEASYVWSWTLAETHFAIICASAPALKLFFGRLLQGSSAQPDSYTSRQRHEYNNFGSDELGAAGSGVHVKSGGGSEEGIYMADMLAFKEARSKAEKEGKELPLFETVAERSGSESPVSITVDVRHGVGLSAVNDTSRTLSENDAQIMEEQSTKSIGRSRGSTDSILGGR